MTGPRPRPRGGPRHTHEDMTHANRHLDGHHDVKALHLALGGAHLHFAGHQRRAGTGRCRPCRQPCGGGHRGQVRRRLCAMTCQDNRTQAGHGAGDTQQHRDRHHRDYRRRATVTVTRRPIPPWRQ